MSAILSAETLNDFIGPSVACIKPVETLPSVPDSSEPTVLREDQTPSAKTAAQISLTDCLACSGCVTTSEAVLVQLQSHTEVLDALQRFPNKRFVALLSPQTRAALAGALGLTDEEVGHMIEHFLCGEGGGFEAVIDTNCFRRISRHYGGVEVLDALGGDAQDEAGKEQKKPILASSCPGWVCYLESTHPDLIPHLSRLKSPQALGGTFIKSVLLGAGAVSSPEDVYVVSIMPCFDKKLEGARGELSSQTWLSGREEEMVRDVDCVITTRELLSLAEMRKIDFHALPRSPLTSSLKLLEPVGMAISIFVGEENVGGRGNGSKQVGSGGGQLAAIISALLRRHEGSTVTVQPGKNPDSVDYMVTSASGDLIAKLSRCYGFRNIQNLVRRLKPAKPRVLPSFGGRSGVTRPAGVVRRPEKKPEIPASYIEVMACPGGCTNGGGQIKYDDENLWSELGIEMKPENQKELLGKIDEAYFSEEEEEANGPSGLSRLLRVDEREAEDVERIVNLWEKTAGVSRDKLLYTSYRRVENDLGKRMEEDLLEIASRNGGGW